MGLLDNLGGALGDLAGQVTSGAAPGLINAVLAKTSFGNLQGLVNQLQQSGLGAQVESWLGGGGNMPVTPAQLEAALGSDQVRQIAAHFGIPVDAALKMLAEHLPATVDQASPNGTVQPA